MMYHVATSVEHEVLLWHEVIGFPFFVTACNVHVGAEKDEPWLETEASVARVITSTEDFSWSKDKI
jgi:hypothetical protein